MTARADSRVSNSVNRKHACQADVMTRTLYAFGSNGSSQLGVGHQEDLAVPTPCLIDEFAISSGIKAIRGGGNHTLLLANDGAAYAAGAVSDGRAGMPAQHDPLDHTNRNLVWQPIVFNDEHSNMIDRFAFVSATWEASVVVSTNGDVIWICGKGNKGELGLGEHVTKQLQGPGRLSDFPPTGLKVTDLASCMSHTVAVLSNGSAWGWGGGRKGQLGDPTSSVWTPREIQGVPFKAVRVACGREFTIVAAAPQDGSYVVLGSDKYGVRSNAPSSLQGWKQVEASWSSVCVLFGDGRLLTWGRNDQGQVAPATVQSIEQIAAGSEHTVARTKDGRVLAWGWGEHGNCGRHASQKYINDLDSTPCECVGAGCATSFYSATV
ncbi:MAG: hypothetical protein Q9162_006489 [Coniocarpon cinnabarinum]